MLALVAAMKEELAGLKRHMAIEDATYQNGCRVFRGRRYGKEALLVQTGVGRERAEKARLILEDYPITALISFGFAGGLTPELSVGDIILCSTLYCGERQSDSCQSDASLLSRSSQVRGGGVARQGKIVTVAQPASRPEVKRALAQAFQADVVDMESYWIARIARERRVPFLAVRVVSDTVQERLPSFEHMLDSNGKLRPGKAIPYLLFHPEQIVSLTRLRRNSRRARINLTAFLDRLMERL